MCGICGFYSSSPLENGTDLLQRMNDQQVHRGPDSGSVLLHGRVGLAHRRLSIIDVSDAGLQPMVSSNGRYAISFNGEVYNFEDIRKSLNTVDYQSRTDTEVVLEAFSQRGNESFKQLNGMFAFAILDRQTNRLTLVRDRFGIKPLYYWFDGKNLAFGSEIKALLPFPGINREIDEQGLHEFLHFGMTLESSTCFRNIKRLKQGCWLTFDGTHLETGSYHDVLDTDSSGDSYETATERVRALLEKSVCRHLVSDVPVGVFLSGGIDSASITALASKHYQGRIKSYTAAFDFDTHNNELEFARHIADQYGTDHHEVMVKADSVPQDIENLIVHHDAPFGDVACLPLYLLSKQLKGEVKVILQGDGGDEIFGGYLRYSRLYYKGLLNLLSYFVTPIKTLFPANSKLYRSVRTIQAFRSPPEQMMAWLTSHETADFPPTKLLSRDLAHKLETGTNPFAVFEKRFQRLRQLDPVQRMLFTDMTVILPDMYFEKVDRATMASSIEVRVPFVENELVSYVTSLPASYKVLKREKKRILRKAMRGIVSDRILDGKKKGLTVPIKQWLKGPLAPTMKETLLDQSNGEVLDLAVTEKAINNTLDGTRDHGFLLFKLMTFCLWRRRYLS